MSEFSRTILAARKRKGIRGKAFAAALTPPVSPATISHWEKGKYLPDRAKLGQIADVLGLDLSELRALHDKISQERSTIPGGSGEISGDVKPAPVVQPAVRNRTNGSRGLPVYETEPGGTGRGFFMSVEPSHMVGRPVKLEGREDVFGFQVATKTMENRYEVGDFVIAELHRRPKARDFVLVELKPAQGETRRHFLLKRLVSDDGDRVRLEQFSPRKAFNVPRKDVLRLYRILQTEDLC